MSEKVYSNKESTDLLKITKDSIKNNHLVEIFARNNFATFLKVKLYKTWLTFNASALGPEIKDYLPNNIELIAEDTLKKVNLEGHNLTLLTNHIMRHPDTPNSKRMRNAFVRTLAKHDCVLPSGETADMNTLDKDSFYGGINTVSFGPTGDYEADLTGKVIITHADGIGTKPNVYLELFKKGLISEEQFLGFVQDGLAMNLNDILVGALSMPEQCYMTNNIVVGRGFENYVDKIQNRINELCTLTSITPAVNNVVQRQDFQGVELDMVLTAIYDESQVPSIEVKKGFVLIGVASNGIHSNGLSGARRYASNLSVDDRLEFYKKLAKPTMLYHDLFKAIKNVDIKAAVNVTGDAFLKIKHLMPKGLDALIDNPQEPQELFKQVNKSPEWPDEEMYNYFNCGTGLVLLVKEEDVNNTLNELSNTDYEAQQIGYIKEGSGQVHINSAFSDKLINY